MKPPATADQLHLRCKRALAEHRRRAKADRQTLDYDPADLERLARAAVACPYCHAVLTPATLAFDHAMPTCRAADYRLENLRVVCAPCNLAKGVMSEEEFLQLLDLLRRWHPRPAGDVLARLRSGGKRYRQRYTP
jgi:5-methylcytosine-specific restriction endonuclease McrA